MPTLTGRLLNTGLVLGGAISAVLAPQASYIAAQRQYVPWAGFTGLSLLLAVMLGAAAVRALQVVAARAGEGSRDALLPLAGGSALPLLLLWVPVALQAPSSAFRVWLPLALLASGGLLAVGTLLRPGAAAWRRPALRVGGVALVLWLVTWASLDPQPGASWSFFLGLAWALYLLVALVGWGAILNRLLLPEAPADWGQRAAWGMAVALAVGGLLNLTWSVSPALVLAFLALGAGAWAEDAAGQRRQLAQSLRSGLRRAAGESVVVVLALAVTALVAVQLAGSLAGTVDTVVEHPPFDLHDDTQAYLVFPYKMLELGSMGSEPFEARRMLSLGGQSFLQALVLVALPVRTIHLLDDGVALLILVGLILGGARRRGLGRGPTMLLLLVLLTLPHLDMRGNTSSLFTGVVLLVSWFRLLAEDLVRPAPAIANAALVAVTAGGLCTLKSTLIPAAVILFAVSAAAHAVRGGAARRAAGEALLAAAMVGVVLLPWMTSVFASSHTLLYPVLGKGFYGGVYTDEFAAISGDFSVPRAELAGATWAQLVSVLPALLVLLFVRDARPRAPATAVIVAAIGTALLLVVMGDPSLSRSLDRYAFPVHAAAFLCLVLAAFERDEESGGQRSGLGAMAAVAIAAAVMLQGARATEELYRQVLANGASAIAGEPVGSETERRALSELQAAMPASGAVLATLPNPFLLDLRSHRVYLNSLPGMAGLPPGLPVFAGGEEVASYLQAHSIRYLAYGGVAQLRDLFTLTEDRILDKYPRSRMRWAMLRYHQRYRQTVEELARSRKRLYADSTTVLLDLSQRVFTVVPSERGADAEGFHDGVWTSGDAVIRNLGCTSCGPFVVVRSMGWHPLGDDLERLELVVEIDGRPLEPLRAGPSGLLYRLPHGASSCDQIRLRSRALAPAQVGARAGGPRLGVDVQAIEIGPDESIVEQPIRTVRQKLPSPFEPEQVERRTGFLYDFGWTDGAATFSAIDLAVGRGERYLVLRLHPVHPYGADTERLGLDVAVNGVGLVLERVEGLDHFFRLYDNVREINKIRISSATFIPNELNGSADLRTLGVPLDTVRLE